MEDLSYLPELLRCNCPECVDQALDEQNEELPLIWDFPGAECNSNWESVSEDETVLIQYKVAQRAAAKRFGGKSA